MDNYVSQFNTAFQERTFWQRVKAVFLLAWQYKGTFAKYMIPLFVISLPVMLIGIGGQIIQYGGALVMCSLLFLYKQEGHLNNVTWNKFKDVLGNVFIAGAIYGIIIGFSIWAPFLVITIVLVFVNPIICGIFVILGFIPLLITSNFGWFKTFLYDQKTEINLRPFKYAWDMMKGNWLNTLAYFFVTSLWIGVVGIGLLIVVALIFIGIWGEVPDDFTFTQNICVVLMSATIVFLAFIYSHFALYLQFEYLHHKYENKQQKENPKDDYQGDPLYRLMNDED